MRFFRESEFWRRQRANHRKNAPVGGRNDQIVPRRWPAFRVPKKRNDPQNQGQTEPSRPTRERKHECIRESGETDNRPAGPMNDRLFQIVTCVPISTTRLGGSR